MIKPCKNCGPQVAEISFPGNGRWQSQISGKQHKSSWWAFSDRNKKKSYMLCKLESIGIESRSKWFYYCTENTLYFPPTWSHPLKCKKHLSNTCSVSWQSSPTSMAVVMVNHKCHNQLLNGLRFQPAQHHLLWCVTPNRCCLIACLDSLCFLLY